MIVREKFRSAFNDGLITVLSVVLWCWMLMFVPAKASPCASLQDSHYGIGVYYYPGWHTTVGRPKAVNSPWDPLFAYPEREPLLGWYKGDEHSVVSNQMQWMCDHGISSVVFDWYYDRDHTRLEQPLDRYLALDRPKPKFSLLWANHNHATTTEEWDRIIEFWADHYLSDESFDTVEGRKVIYIFSLQRMARDAAADDASLGEWLSRARSTVRERGLGELYFVGGAVASSPVIATAKEAGVDALSVYNFSSGPGDRRVAHGYPELDSAYRRQWGALSRSSGLPLVVPMTSGWDRRPWGGSEDPGRDPSIATPAQFQDHLAAARQAMDASGLRRGVICCWNEYGEGSFIEPTREHGFEMLEQVGRVFVD